MWRSGANTNTSMEKLVAETRNEHNGTKMSHYNFQIFNVDHLEKVCSNVRQKLSRLQGDEMLNIDVNAMIWGIFTSAIMKAAVHLGQDYQQNLCTTKDTDFEKVRTLFDISQKFILDHKDEIFGISTIELNTVPWMRTILLFDKAMKLSKAKVHVYSDSDKASWNSKQPTASRKYSTQRKTKRASSHQPTHKPFPYAHFPKDTNCKLCRVTKMLKGRCGFVDPMSADHDVRNIQSE